MDFSTNHFAVVFWFVWFIVGKFCIRYGVFADEMYHIALVAAFFNAVLFCWVHARQTRKGRLPSHMLNIAIILSFLVMYTTDMVPAFSVVVVCFIAGVYFAFDADFYYGADIPMYWMYGWYLVCAANKGTSMVIGVVSASVVVSVGWFIGQAMDDIDNILLDLFVDTENSIFSITIDGVISVLPVVSYIGISLIAHVGDIQVPLNIHKQSTLLAGFVLLLVYSLYVVYLSCRQGREASDNARCKKLQQVLNEEINNLSNTSWVPPDDDWLLETRRLTLSMMFGDSNQLIQRLIEGRASAREGSKEVEVFDRCLVIAKELDAVPNKVTW